MTEHHSRRLPIKLFLVRHAHRDTSDGRELDNGLSPKGHEQALLLASELAPKLRGKKVRLVTSPKERCRETLAPLAARLEVRMVVWASVDEQKEGERGSAFRERVVRAVRRAERVEVDALVLCSHGDFLPLAAHTLGEPPQEFRKGAWKELTVGE